MKTSILLFSLIFLFGCDNDRHIDFKSGWSTSDEYWKSYKSTDGDENTDLYLRLIVDKSYSYNNFVFAFEASSPDGLYVADTISFKLDTATQSSYKGEYINDKKVISDMFLKKGRYNFKVKQIMRDTLFGVTKCTLRIIPKKENIDGER